MKIFFSIRTVFNLEDEVILNFYHNNIIDKNIEKNEILKILKI